MNSSIAGVTVVAVDPSRGAEETKMRMIGWKAIGVASLGLALAALVGCGQGDSGSQTAGEALDEATGNVAPASKARPMPRRSAAGRRSAQDEAAGEAVDARLWRR
jgi:hypothetical protein